MAEKFEQHISVEQDQISAIDCLEQVLKLGRQQIKRVMQNGAVWLESAQGIDRLRRAKKALKKGETMHVYFDEQVQGARPPAASLVADEGEYSIWDKPAGMYSQGTKWGDHCTIYRWVEQHLVPQRPAFVVHRLDRAASGLMILAHKKSVAAKFSAMFERHEIYKKYRAEVEGIFDPGELPLEISQSLDGRAALSRIVAIQSKVDNNTTMVWLEIESGRKHQIRRHLSGLGYPIVGDRLYGSRVCDRDLQLRSVELSFICPLSGRQKRWVVE